MSASSFPWFGAFTQTLRDFKYDPVTNWSRMFSFNPSLFTYNAGDEEVEQEVIDHVGSYGSQLSTILKLLDVLKRHVKLGDLDKADQQAVQEFNKLFHDARVVVAKHKGELTRGDEQRVVAYLKKAAAGDFGERAFRELKEIFANASAANGDARRTLEPDRSSAHNR